MTGTTGSLSLFLFARLFLTVESQTGPVLPPQNLSLLWIEDFKPMLTWTQPQHSGMNCNYVVRTNDDEGVTVPSPPWTSPISHEEEAFLSLSVQTVCGERQSNSTVLVGSYPEMVRNVKVYWYSEENASVFWEPAVPGTDVHFFYQLINEDLTTSIDDIPPLRECSSYSFTGDVRTGCELQVNLMQSICILFNGTENNKLFRNTCHKAPLYDFTVKLPPLEWTVKKTGNKFNISWTTPRTRHHFEQFMLNYTECETTMTKLITAKIDETSTELNVVSHCRYRMTMQAVYKRNITTPWSVEKYFDADADPNVLLYAVVLIPLMFAGLTALTVVCCRKHIWKKNRIFVKVPQPRDFITETSDNNNKITAYNLYFPAEEENCQISLVLEPEIDSRKDE